MNQSQTNRLLGYPADARLLILNADDFGMCSSVNEAIIRTLQEGLISSTSLMFPCPGAPDAMRFLADHPEVPFGVHLTAISDSVHNRWRPLTPPEKAPSLVDPDGYFYPFEAMQAFLAQVNLDQMEMEFRAQIEAVLAAGLEPDHLDWHSLRLGGRTDIDELMIRLAKEYGLAFRVMKRSWTEKLLDQGLPAVEHDVLDSYQLDPVTKPAHYARMLRELPAGLSEWAIHPGIDNAELLALEPANNHERQSDYAFWISEEAKQLVEDEGIILLDYRPLQEFWREHG